MSEMTSYEPGVPCWVDLATTDLPGGVAFYSRLFGWDAEVPPNWMPYFAVADTDATASLAQALGGSVTVPPSDIPVGRFAMLNDPQSGFFSVIRRAA